MDFPLLDLIDSDLAKDWIEKYFHPDGLRCPHCQTSHEKSRFFRANRGSGLEVYRCSKCHGVYSLYSGTVFECSQLTPEQVILVIQGVMQGKSSLQLAREVGLTPKTALKWRQRLQKQAKALQPNSPLPDRVTESDEMYQNAGEKRKRTL
jgi:transposase-like protein